MAIAVILNTTYWQREKQDPESWTPNKSCERRPLFLLRIPVVRDDRLVGMISRMDLMNQLIDSHLINVYGG
jgi:hypothetical protein